jgi:hypothetical protein
VAGVYRAVYLDPELTPQKAKGIAGIARGLALLDDDVEIVQDLRDQAVGVTDATDEAAMILRAAHAWALHTASSSSANRSPDADPDVVSIHSRTEQARWRRAADLLLVAAESLEPE